MNRMSNDRSGWPHLLWNEVSKVFSLDDHQLSSNLSVASNFYGPRHNSEETQLKAPLSAYVAIDEKSTQSEIATSNIAAQIINPLSSQNSQVSVIEQDVYLPNENNFNDFVLSCFKGNADEVAKHLKNPYLVPYENDYSAFRFAIQEGHAEVVTLLLKDSRMNSNPDKSRELFRLACVSNQCEIVKLFLYHIRTLNPIEEINYQMLGASRSSIEIVNILLEDDRVAKVVPEEQKFNISKGIWSEIKIDDDWIII